MDEIAELKKRLQFLEEKRAYQWDIAPGAVKNRHLAEPNTYFRTGLAADRPTTGASIKLGNTYFGTQYWFAYDTNVLSVWNPSSSAWKSVTLS